MTRKKLIDPKHPLRSPIDRKAAELRPAIQSHEILNKRKCAESDSKRARKILGLNLSPEEIEESKALGFL